MKVYTYGTNTIDTYAFPHSEVVVALNAAKGFQALGYDTVALWGGPSCVIDGVPHENARQAAPTDDDLLLLMHPITACIILANPEFSKLHGAGTRWLFTNGFYSRKMCRTWGSFYNAVFTEGEGHVGILQQEMPGIPVEHLMLGCSHDLDIRALDDPYPKDGLRYIFYAGRISQLDKFKSFLAELPPSYRIVCASQQILQSSRRIEINISNDDRTKAHYNNIHGSGIHLVSEETARRFLDDEIQDDRFKYIGCLPFGTFHNYHHFAFASLDFGYAELPPTISCKIFDAMRAGGRIVADGQARSYELISKYDAGKVVPFGDWSGMVRMLDGWDFETPEDREKRGLRFREGESWNARIRSLERYL